MDSSTPPPYPIEVHDAIAVPIFFMIGAIAVSIGIIFALYVIRHCLQWLHDDDPGGGIPPMFDIEAGLGTGPSSHYTTTSGDHHPNLSIMVMKVLLRRKWLEPIIVEVEKETGGGTVDLGGVCTICLEEFGAGERCGVLPLCNHWFHPLCIGRWLVEIPTCPVCRSKVALVSNFKGIFGIRAQNFASTLGY